MVLLCRDLDERTRDLMVEEIERDVEERRLYVSGRLSARGRADWPDLISSAAREENDGWLAGELLRMGRLNEFETTVRGQRRVPRTAHETLAEGEFNRFYIRAVCRRAIDDHIPVVIVYRAKMVERPRPGSEERIGAEINPTDLLEDLRENHGGEIILGVPGGPNSGLSVHLPE